jgi:hypothetical protein
VPHTPYHEGAEDNASVLMKKPADKLEAISMKSTIVTSKCLVELWIRNARTPSRTLFHPIDNDMNT